MKKVMKRSFSLLLAALLVLSLVPTAPARADGGNCATWSITDDASKTQIAENLTAYYNPKGNVTAYPYNNLNYIKIVADTTVAFVLDEEFRNPANGAAIIEVEYVTNYGFNATLYYANTSNKAAQAQNPSDKPSTNTLTKIDVYELTDAGFDATYSGIQHVAVYFTVTATTYIKSITFKKVEPAPEETTPEETTPEETTPEETEPVEPEWPEWPEALVEPGDIACDYASMGDGDYSWLNVNVDYGSTDGTYQGWDRFGWQVTLSPAEDANVKVDARVVDSNGNEKGKVISKSVAIEGNKTTPVLNRNDFNDLDFQTIGDFFLTAIINIDGEPVATVQTVFRRSIGELGYSKVEYRSGAEWFNLTFDAIDEDKSYASGQPLDWFFAASPASTANSVTVKASVIDENGAIVVNANDQTVNCSKTPIITRLLSPSDFTNMSLQNGKFAVIVELYVNDTKYGGGYAVFERTADEWTAPQVGETPDVYGPGKLETCKPPTAISITNNSEVTKWYSLNVTIVDAQGASAGSKGFNKLKVVAGETKDLISQAEVKNLFKKHREEVLTVNISGYCFNGNIEESVNQSFTFTIQKHEYNTDGICSKCNTNELNVTITGKTLLLDNNIVIEVRAAYLDPDGNNYMSLSSNEIIESNDCGILFWKNYVTSENATLGTESYSSKYSDSNDYNGAQEYLAESVGIPAKEYNDKVYFRAYVKIDDKVYYSDITEYSVVDYCVNTLTKANNGDQPSVAARPVVVAILNYGAAAQTYFGYKTNNLANKTELLSDEQRNLVNFWDDNYLPEQEDAEDIEGTVVTCTGKTLSLKGNVEMVFYMAYKPEGTDGAAEILPEGATIKFYFWEEDDYNYALANGALTENSSSYPRSGNEIQYVNSNDYGHEYIAYANGLPAKRMGENIYVKAVVTIDNDTVYESTVVCYSAVQYAAIKIAEAETNNEENAQKLATLLKWMVIYGEVAKTYFGND